MHARQLNIPLSKIVAVRIRCRNKGCGVSFEVPIEELKQKFRHGRCPVCQVQLVPPGNNSFELLTQAVASLAATCKQMDFAFVYPDDDLSLLS